MENDHRSNSGRIWIQLKSAPEGSAASACAVAFGFDLAGGRFLQLSAQHQAQHAEIADERPPGMSEGSRLISLDQEMPGPGEAVADGNPEQGPDVVSRGNCADEHGKSQNDSTGMQQTVAFVPKLVVMVLVLTLTMPWLIDQMVQYTQDLIVAIPENL